MVAESSTLSLLAFMTLSLRAVTEPKENQGQKHSGSGPPWALSLTEIMDESSILLFNKCDNKYDEEWMYSNS